MALMLETQERLDRTMGGISFGNESGSSCFFASGSCIPFL